MFWADHHRPGAETLQRSGEIRAATRARIEDSSRTRCPGAANWGHGTWDRELGTGGRELGAANWGQGTWGRELETGNWGQGIGDLRGGLKGGLRGA